MLELAARVGARGFGLVEPNPMVGAVLARDGKVIGVGHHRRLGHLHAERDALANCRARGENPRGATAYVTLEPCCHHGRQPPCTDALIEAGIREVVFAVEDPDPISGGGTAVLREAGIEVRQSQSSAAAIRLSEPFIKRIKQGLPWVIAKWAQTIDGRIATRTGESQWISNDRSRLRVHRLRGRVDAIVTGMGTVIADDPMLTPRGVSVRRSPARVVLDTNLDIDPSCRLIQTAGEYRTIIACREHLVESEALATKRETLEKAGVELLGVPGASSGLDLSRLLEELWKRLEFATVLIESGPGLLGAMFEQDLVDDAVVYVAPLLLGDEQARSAATGRVASTLVDGRRFELLWNKRIDDDVELLYRRLRADK